MKQSPFVYCLHHGRQVPPENLIQCQYKNCCAFRIFGSQADLDRFRAQKRKPRYQFIREAGKFYNPKAKKKDKLK